MKKLNGIVIAMITPVDGRDRIDMQAIEILTDFLIDRGVQGLFTCGTTGEMYHLTTEERMLVSETVVRHTAGRIPVYVHAGAMCYDDTLRLAKHAREIGADGVSVMTPAYFKADDREQKNYFVSIANELPSDFPVYLYAIPQLAGNDISAELLQDIIIEAPNVVGIKHSFADLIRTQQYTWGAPGFSVMHGCDALTVPLLSMGCDGVISGTGCVYPELIEALYQAYQRSDIPTAIELQKHFNVIVDLCKQGTNMAYYKAALHRRGIPAGHMKLPQLDLTDDELSMFYIGLEAFEKRLPDGILKPFD